MTKLYCPKGHEVPEALPAWHENGDYAGDSTFCPTCDRFYSNLDCSKETKKDQPDFCFSEKKVKMVCLQDIVPPLKVASTLFEKPVSNSPTPKNESQIAIDWVIEALEYSLDKIGGEQNEYLFHTLLNFRDRLRETKKC